MCGIAGFSGEGDEWVLGRMNDTLTHRGPDDAGLKVVSRRGSPGMVGLAQRRLAIIDLSPAGHQPLANEDGTVWISFNGEVYNYQEIRRSLTRQHTFRGQSDTEVIVHLYEELGEGVFSKLEGMFAIALYDTKRDLLYLARDRMGKKPLYWSVQGGTLLFGSELKALMAHPRFQKKLDLLSLHKYLLYEYVPTPHTIFKDTHKLEPGTYLAWDGTQVRQERFWKPTFLPKATSFGSALHELDRELAASVARRLVADVPVGIALSGGLDSSTIAYYATRAGTSTVKTFAIGFDEPSFDESAYARQVAQHLGTEHHEETLRAADCLALVPEIGDLLDEPLADASVVPTYLLARFMRREVTVALGGDGGDELFAGYDTFLAERFASLYGRVPAPLRAALRRLVHRLPTSHVNMSLDFKLKKATEDFEGDPRYRAERWLSAFSDAARHELAHALPDGLEGRMYEDIDRYYGEMDSHEPYDALGYLYERMYLMDQVMVKVDRATMAHALEARAPFLDTRVVDLANHLPSSWKLHGLTRKYLLKKLMEGKLPHSIIYRKKKGFGMPVGSWLRGDLAPLLTDLLGPRSLARMGFFDPAYVARLMGEHRQGTADHRKKLWTLLVFALWWRRWMG